MSDAHIHISRFTQAGIYSIHNELMGFQVFIKDISNSLYVVSCHIYKPTSMFRDILSLHERKKTNILYLHRRGPNVKSVLFAIVATIIIKLIRFSLST